MALNVLCFMFAPTFVTYVLGNSENIDINFKILLIEKTIKAKGMEIAGLNRTVKNQQNEINRLIKICTCLQKVNKENQISAFQTNETNFGSKKGSKVDLQAMNSLNGAKKYSDIDNNTNEKPMNKLYLQHTFITVNKSKTFSTRKLVYTINEYKNNGTLFLTLLYSI